MGKTLLNKLKTPLMIIALAILPSQVLAGDSGDVELSGTYIFVDNEDIQFNDHQKTNIKRIMETTIATTRELMPGLADKIQVTLRIIDRDLSMVYGVTGRADRPNEIEVSLSSIYEGGLDKAIEDGFTGTFFHELHHTVRGWTIYGNKFGQGIDIAAVNEGLADVFGETLGGHPINAFPADVDFDSWTREIMALPKDANYGEWMYLLPDGREGVGYRTGAYLVRKAMQNSGLNILAISKVSVPEIYEMAGY